MKFNPALFIICDECEKSFSPGEMFILSSGPHAIYKIDIFGGYQYPYTQYGIPMEDQNFYHAACVAKSTKTYNLDTLKEAINVLQDKERLELYKYLFHTYRCRI